MDEYLQIHVMGGCWCVGDRLYVGSKKSGTMHHKKCKCGNYSMGKVKLDGEPFVFNHPDFSTPTDYEALRKQLVKLGEWVEINIFLTHKECCREGEPITFDDWEETELSARVEVIHEYAMSRGVEYWKEKRG